MNTAIVTLFAFLGAIVFLSILSNVCVALWPTKAPAKTPRKVRYGLFGS